MKKWMDRNGRGPAHPLPKPQIKVRLLPRQMLTDCLCVYERRKDRAVVAL